MPTLLFDDLDEGRFPPGTLLEDRYRITGVLGRGGMGEVYRADDLVLRQGVALKFLPELLERQAAFRSRLLREVQVTRFITHPAVCRVYDVGENDGRLFISMELVDGDSLDALLRRIGRLPASKALDLARQIANGLAAAHQEGILHRDLKPSNLMVDGLGQARIMDFGMAGVAESLRDAELLEGTVAYMAPEQAAGFEVTARSDLYSLGLVLYEMFTGRPVFEGDADELVRRHRDEVPTPPSRWVEGLEPHVERLILRCLAKDPRDRPASALEVAAALAERPAASPDTASKALLVCELVDLDGPEMDDAEALELLELHDQVARSLLDEHEGSEIDTGDDFQLLFDHPWSALRYALAYHQALDRVETGTGSPLAGRVSIHLVEVHDGGEAGATPRVEVLDRETAVRLACLAAGRQTLLTRDAFDLARQSAAADPGLHWLAHGAYEVEGVPRCLEIFEVGATGRAPLVHPPESDRAHRLLTQETVSGWRPAPGLPLPRRAHWVMERKLSEGGFGEVWLGAHAKTGDRRVFKFCYESESLRGLEREITLFRLLKEELGDRDDITRIVDWNFDEAPYYIEAEYTAGGSLLEWAEQQGGLERIPLETRLEIVAQVAAALAAAHSVGVLHKDVKPGNVLIVEEPGGRPRARLSDFGIGRVTDRRRLLNAGITELGLTETAVTEITSPLAGTPLYRAPELLEGKPPTLQADIYALGVMLYQVVVADFSRALAPGWRRDVGDALLEADIAAAVDGTPERRLSNALRLAERLRDLDARRARVAAERRERDEAWHLKSMVDTWRRRGKLTLSILLVALGFAGAMAWLADRAHRAATGARQTAEFLADLLAMTDPFDVAEPRRPAGGVTVREILDRGAERLRTELADQPEVRALLMHQVAKSYRSHGLHDEAESLMRQALDLRREVFGRRHPEVASSWNELGALLQVRGRLEQAEEAFREALEQRRRFDGERSASVAESLNDLGNLLADKGELDLGRALVEDALEMRREVHGPNHVTVAQSLNNLAAILYRQGEHEKAEPLYREALDALREHLGPDHPDVATTLNNLAVVLKAQGKLSEAKPFYREALALTRRVLGDEHTHVALKLSNLGMLTFEEGKHDEAEALWLEAHGIYQRILGDDHPNTAIVLSHLAKVKIVQQEFDVAVSWLRECLTVFRKTFPEGHGRIAEAERLMSVAQSKLDGRSS